jgi:hypothetical protein
MALPWAAAACASSTPATHRLPRSFLTSGQPPPPSRRRRTVCADARVRGRREGGAPLPAAASGVRDMRGGTRLRCRDGRVQHRRRHRRQAVVLGL